MRNIKYKAYLIFLASLFSILGCKKVEHSIDDVIVSFNEGTASSIQIGKKLKVGFITNNISSFDLSIEKEGTVLLNDKVTLSSGQRIVEKELEIPLDDDFIGEAWIKISYQSGNQSQIKTHAITFEESNPVMYLVGGSTGAGWEPSKATPLALYEEGSKTKFETYEYLTADGGFKFLPTNVDWTGGYGKATAAGKLLQDGEAGNLTVAENGFYRIRMDAEGLTYEVLKLSIGVIGSATRGGWDADTDMEFVGAKGSYLWKLTVDLIPGEFKFRANDGWDINFGGTADEIKFDGGNLPIATAGTYEITLDLKPGAYKASITKK